MPTVPKFEPSVSDRPIFQQGVNVQANPNDMGAAIGQGLQGLAQGGAQLGGALQAVKQMEDLARAKEADNQFATWARNAQYGEGGYMTLEGRAAVDGRSAFEQSLEEKRKEFGASLAPGAATAYNNASTARTHSILDQTILHQAQGRKQWFTDTTTARMETFSSDALAAFDKPAVVDQNIAAGLKEIEQAGKLHGWTNDILQNKEADYMSGVRKDIVLRMNQSDPLGAQKYFDEHLHEITGPHQYGLHQALDTGVKTEQAKQHAAEILGGGPDNSGGAEGMIAGREGFISTSKWDVNHFRVGFGSDTITRADGTIVPVTAGMNVTRADAERDLKRRVDETQQSIIKKVGADKWAALTAGAQSALTSVGYNYGSLPDDVAAAVSSGNPAEIAKAVSALGSDNKGVNQTRRDQEAAMIAGGAAPAHVGGVAGYLDVEKRLAEITDPDVRDLTRKMIDAKMSADSAAATARTKLAKEQAFGQIEKGSNPDELPMEVKTTIGVDGMASLWEYYKKKAGGEHTASAPELLYRFRQDAATDPAAFAKLDLNDYRNLLDPQDFKELTDKQSAAITDQRKARADGITLSTAFSQANDALAGVGISTAGLQGGQRDEVSKRVALFQNTLADQLQEFKTANDGRNPTDIETRSMINQLLLPIVLKQPGAGWFGTTKETGGKFLFEAGSRPDSATVDVQANYSDIPIDLRQGIRADLEQELGRKPSDDEVTSRYEQFVLNR